MSKTKERIMLEIDDRKLRDKMNKFAQKHGKKLNFIVKEALQEFLENHKECA